MLLRTEYSLPLLSKCLIVILRMAALVMFTLTLVMCALVLSMLTVDILSLFYPATDTAIDTHNLPKKIQSILFCSLWVWGLSWILPQTISKARVGHRQKNAYYGMETLHRLLGFGISIYAVAQWQATMIHSLYALACALCAWQLLHHANDYSQHDQSNAEPPPTTALPLITFILLIFAKMFM